MKQENNVTYTLGAMQPDMSVEVAIVGGGMAGLALAVGLQDRGIDCHVFEAAAELRTSTATIISIATNGEGIGRQNGPLSKAGLEMPECLEILPCNSCLRAFLFSHSPPLW